MPRRIRVGSTIPLVAILCMLVIGLTPAAADESLPELASTLNDEVILLTSSGFIQIVDPFTAPGKLPANWTSPEGGWTHVATGDFNGNGSQEIIAIGGSSAKIYHPFPMGGTPVQFEMNISPYQFTHALAADIDGDGRDELILQRTDSVGDIRARVLIFDGNPAGTSWTEIRNMGYGAQWLDIIAGNFIGDGKKELALSREPDNLILIMNPQTGGQIARLTAGKEFIRLAAGDLNRNGYDELIAVRDVISISGSNWVVLRIKGSGPDLETLASGAHTPPFLWPAGGDFNGDGKDEIALLRNHHQDKADVGLLVRDLAGNILRSMVIGRGWTDMQVGDLNGNGRQEVLILKANEVRAIDVSTGNTIWSRAGGYRNVFAVGNVDGTGIVSGPTLGVAPTSLSFELDYAGVLPAAQRVDVTNTTSQEAINWSASVNPVVPWLTVTPISGATPGAFFVNVNTSTLTPGTHATSIVVTGGAGVSNSPQTISVSLLVRAPAMVVSPQAINLSTRPDTPIADRYLNVTQQGGGSAIRWVAAVLHREQWEGLQAQAEAVEEAHVTSAGLEAVINGEPVLLESLNWIAISPTAGNTPGTITASFDSTGLDMGAYQATIVVDGGSGVLNRLGWCDVNLALVEPRSYIPLLIKAR